MTYHVAVIARDDFGNAVDLFSCVEEGVSLEEVREYADEMIAKHSDVTQRVWYKCYVQVRWHPPIMEQID